MTYVKIFCLPFPVKLKIFFWIFSTYLKILVVLNTKFIFSVTFNINLLLNDFYILGKKEYLNSKLILIVVKWYHEFGIFFRLRQLIKVPTKVTASSSTILDPILAGYPCRINQCRVINVSLLDPQLIYCTRKISKINRLCDIDESSSVRSNVTQSIFLNQNYRN